MTSSTSRYLVAALVSFLFFISFSFLFLFIVPEYVYPLSLPLYGLSLILMIMASPILLILVYGLTWALVPDNLREVERIPKSWKGWAFVYFFSLAYWLYWASWAFIFDTFTPFIPLFYRQIIAPMLIGLLTLIILGRAEGFWEIIRRLCDI